MANKVSKSLGVIYKMKNALPVSILPMVYCTLLPYYQYCNMVCVCNYPSNLHKLSLLQKRAIRIINAAEFRADAADLFKRHRQLTLVDINKLQIAIFVFKSLNNMLPSVFMDYFKCNSELHRRSTRSANNLHINRYNINTRYFSINVQEPIVWNGLDSKLREISHLSRFKRLVQDSLYTIECFWTDVNMNC